MLNLIFQLTSNVITQPWNLSCINIVGNATLTHNLITVLPNCITANFSWYPLFFWAILMLSLFFIFSYIENRTRFMVVSFFGLVIGWAMSEYGFGDGVTVGIISTIVFLITAIYVWLFD